MKREYKEFLAAVGTVAVMTIAASKSKAQFHPCVWPNRCEIAEKK